MWDSWHARRRGDVENIVRSSRILLLAPGHSQQVSQIDEYVCSLARALSAHLGEHIVVAAAGTTSPARSSGRAGSVGVNEGACGVKVYTIPAGPLWLQGLRRVLAAERIELVNTHAPPSAIAALVAHACGNLPFVLTYHGDFRQRKTHWQEARFGLGKRTLLPAASHRADRIICSSHSARSSSVRLFGARATTIVPGLDAGIFRPCDGTAPTRVLSVGLLGGVTPSLVELLEAFRIVRAHRPALRLDIMCNADASGAIERTVREMGLGRGVGVIEALDRASLASACQAAVVVGHAPFEGYPTELAEAMACGRPAIATSDDDTRVLVENGVTGLLVPPCNIPALASALENVLEDQGLASRLGAAARNQVLENLSWETQAARTSEVFEQARELRLSRRRSTVAVVTPYYPPHVGGAENYAERVARAVHDAPGLDAIVITSNHLGRRGTAELVGDVPVIRLGAWFKLSTTPISPLWLMQVRRILRQERVGLINTHSPVPYLADVAVAVARGIPVAMTYHSGRRSMVKGIPWLDALLDFYETQVLTRAFKRAEATIAVSPVSLAFGRQQTNLIPPGVDTSVFTPRCVGRAAGDPREVLYVGRLDRTSAWKGVDILLDAFVEVARAAPNTSLVLVGSGDAEPDHRYRAAILGVADRVVFRGFQRGDGLVEAYQRAEVVVLPSLSEAESFGMALLEAMSCARPVVGSRVGGIPWLLADGEAGLLVPPGDAHALAESILRILADPELAGRLGAKARHRAREFDWNAHAARTLELFRSLLSLDDPVKLNANQSSV